MMVRPTLSPPDLNPDGITPNDWVRKIACKRVGRVEIVTNDTALVDWLTGTKELVGCIYLRRVPTGEGKDKRRTE